MSPKDYQKERRKPTQNEKKILLEEVNGLCPVAGCGKSLVNEKNGRVYEDFEVAHIFPNRFKDDMEATILADVEAAYDAIRKGDMGKAENLLSEITDIVGMDDPVVSRIKLEMARKNRLAK